MSSRPGTPDQDNGRFQEYTRVLLIHPSSFSLDAVAQAQSARKAALKGTAKVARKIRTSASFRRPKTLALPRAPKYARKAVPSRADKMDQFAIIKFPLNTESSMRQIENHNTLVFVCDVRANKAQIKASVKSLYGVEVAHVNTLIRYVLLAPW